MMVSATGVSIVGKESNGALSRKHLSSLSFAKEIPSVQELSSLLGLKKEQANCVHHLFETAKNERYGSLPSFDALNFTADEWQKITGAIERIEASQVPCSALVKKVLRMIDFFRADVRLRELWREGSSRNLGEVVVSEKSQTSGSKTLLDEVERVFEQGARIHSVVEDRLRPVKFYRTQKAGILPEQELEVRPDIDRLESWSITDKFPQEQEGIIQASVENAWHVMGGLAVVVKGRHKAQAEQGQYNMWGYYPLYIQEIWNEELDDLKPYGVIQHLYDFKKVETTVWMSVKHKSFFVMPSGQEAWGLFDVVNREQVYVDTSKASYFERSVYLGSALAAFSIQYNPSGIKLAETAYKSLPKNIRVVLADSMAVGACAFELISIFSKTTQKVKSASEMIWRLPLRVGMLHGHGGHDLPESLFEGVGIKRRGPYDYPAHSHLSYGLHADVLVPVSKAYAQKLLSRDSYISEQFSRLPPSLLKSKMHPILNGLDPAQFDCTDPKILGRFAPVFAQSPTKAKAELRRVLYEQGLIADPKAFLAVFVGRYAVAKGVYLLKSMAEAVVKAGGQVVCMGIPDTAMQDLEDLEKVVNAPDSELYGKVKIYKKAADQNTLLEGTTLKKGTAIRAAASIGLMPSIEEPMGLVALEYMLQGSIPVVPCHEGFKDTCVALNLPGESGKRLTLEEGANAVMYPGALARSPEAAESAVTWAIENWVLKLSDQEMDQAIFTIRQKTIASRSWYDTTAQSGVIDAYVEMYKTSLQVKQEPTLLQKPQSSFVNAEQKITLREKIKALFGRIGFHLRDLAQRLRACFLKKKPLYVWRSHEVAL